MSYTWYFQPLRKLEGYSLQQCQPLYNPQLWSCNNISNANGCSILISQDQFCTLESSTLTTNHSASTVSLSPNKSSLSQQISGEEDVNELKHKLKELETVMLGPDVDFLETYDDSVATRSEIDSWRQLMEVMAWWLMSELRQLGQRLGAYMLEGLVALLSTSSSSINKFLKLGET